MKRLDFFVSEREVEPICQALRQAGAPGYTVMRHVTGLGHGGTVSEGMDFSGLGANAHVVVFCADSLLDPIRLGVKPTAVLASFQRLKPSEICSRWHRQGPPDGYLPKHCLTICKEHISSAYRSVPGTVMACRPKCLDGRFGARPWLLANIPPPSSRSR